VYRAYRLRQASRRLCLSSPPGHPPQAHTKADAPLRAVIIVQQWLNQRGPCYFWSDQARVCRRVVALARRHAFEEVPAPSALRQGWQRAFARWCKLRKQRRKECHA
jgi:hypothetical protein